MTDLISDSKDDLWTLYGVYSGQKVARLHLGKLLLMTIILVSKSILRILHEKIFYFGPVLLNDCFRLACEQSWQLLYFRVHSIYNFYAEFVYIKKEIEYNDCCYYY